MCIQGCTTYTVVSPRLRVYLNIRTNQNYTNDIIHYCPGAHEFGLSEALSHHVFLPKDHDRAEVGQWAGHAHLMRRTVVLIDDRKSLDMFKL